MIQVQFYQSAVVITKAHLSVFKIQNYSFCKGIIVQKDILSFLPKTL